MPAFLAFMTAKRLGLANWLWIILALGAAVAVFLWFRAEEKADDKANQEIGRTIERETNLTETITRVEEANHAREANRTRTDEQRTSDCLRRSRTPENC